MWAYLSSFFNMNKSLKLDTSIYPFVACHEHCENDCKADVCSHKVLHQRYKELGIQHDRTTIFVRLLSYINNATHSFINLRNKDPEVDECLKLLQVFSPADVTRLFRRFSLTKDSLFNNCSCCMSIKGRVLHVRLKNIFKTCAYCYYTFETMHGSELCLETNDLLNLDLRYEDALTVSLASYRCLRKGDTFYITVPSKKYLSFLSEILSEYVKAHRPAFAKLPHATSLMAVEKLYGTCDRNILSPIGQLMDAWVLDGRRIYFLSEESICSYDFRVGIGAVQRYSKWVQPEDVYLLNKFIRCKVTFQGTLLVPESSELFQQYLLKRHSPRSILS
jgi:hypothetical protein